MPVCPATLPGTQSGQYPAQGPAHQPTGPGAALGSSQLDAGAGETEDCARLSASARPSTPSGAQPGGKGKTPGQTVLNGYSSRSRQWWGALRPLLPTDCPGPQTKY